MVYELIVWAFVHGHVLVETQTYHYDPDTDTSAAYQCYSVLQNLPVGFEGLCTTTLGIRT
jgi:hypothetical protein